jgi:hypothetical protein
MFFAGIAPFHPFLIIILFYLDFDPISNCIYIFLWVANSMVEYSAFKCGYDLLHISMKQRIRLDFW